MLLIIADLSSRLLHLREKIPCDIWHLDIRFHTRDQFSTVGRRWLTVPYRVLFLVSYIVSYQQ